MNETTTHPLEDLKARLRIYRIGEHDESESIPQAIFLDREAWRALKELLDFVEFAKGDESTKHNKLRSCVIAIAAGMLSST